MFTLIFFIFHLQCGLNKTFSSCYLCEHTSDSAVSEQCNSEQITNLYANEWWKRTPWFKGRSLWDDQPLGCMQLHGKPDTKLCQYRPLPPHSRTHAHAHTHGSKVKLALLSSPNWEELLSGQEGVRVWMTVAGLWLLKNLLTLNMWYCKMSHV